MSTFWARVWICTHLHWSSQGHAHTDNTLWSQTHRARSLLLAWIQTQWTWSCKILWWPASFFFCCCDHVFLIISVRVRVLYPFVISVLWFCVRIVLVRSMWMHETFLQLKNKLHFTFFFKGELLFGYNSAKGITEDLLDTEISQLPQTYQEDVLFGGHIWVSVCKFS